MMIEHSWEAAGFSVLLPLRNGTLLDAIESKAFEVVVLLVREDRPVLKFVDARASHDAPQDPGFKRRGKRCVPRINSALL
jgi:hypothetical protein